MAEAGAGDSNGDEQAGGGGNRGDAAQNQPARNRGGITFSPTLLIESVKSPHFWAPALLVCITLIVAYLTNFLRFRDIIYTFGFTFIGLITVVLMIGFILYGWATCKNDIAKFYIATALFVWMLDLLSEKTFLIGRILGPVYQGFEFNLLSKTWPINMAWNVILLPIIASSASFAFLYINMVYKIIKKEYIAFILSFGLIVLFNYISNQLPTYLRSVFTIPYGKIIFFILLIVLGFLAWIADKKRTGEEIPEFFSTLYLVFVFSFFWLNTGWQNNIKAWFHVLFIIAFGFGYIKPKESSKSLPYILIATLLIIDFYGYGFLYSTDVLALQFIPPLVIFVIFYCYHKETEYGTKNYTYPVAAFTLLVTFILLMSVSVGGTTSADVPFIARKGTTYKEVLGQFGDKVRYIIEGRLDIATAGLYRGNVEKNRYESLGVYFTNIRAADPRFYKDDYITVWGSLRSKTYQDAVVINFSCYRWKDNKKISADEIIPKLKFPIFTLEEVDTECTFFPSTEKGKEISPGTNTITFSADYNFGTDAYLKSYFIDRERFRASAREGIEPLTQYGIKDKNPAAVFTNGPVEIGLGTGQSLIPVSEGYAVKPAIGITLTNRQEIQDKDKRIITRWEGKIKNITELILLVPPGISLGGINEKQNLEKCYSKKPEERIFCPCSMPFKSYSDTECKNTCDKQVRDICEKACSDAFKGERYGDVTEEAYQTTEEAYQTLPSALRSCFDECTATTNNCKKECDFLFATTGEQGLQGKYTGYALDVGSLQFKDLNKDIDKHRSFQCRFEPSSAVLGSEPITTRYFRVRARYNYLLENSVTINVEETPTEVLDTVPDQVCKIASEFTLGDDIYTANKVYKCDLISAIAWVESQWRHCCKEVGRTSSSNCVHSGEKKCTPDKILKSYDGSSIGIMQIHYYIPKPKTGETDTQRKDRELKLQAEINQLEQKHCGGETIFDYDCNMKVGEAILKQKYDTFKDGCGKYPKLKPACENCQSNRAPHTKYSEYRRIEAALRGYNGWACGNGADTGYVEKVKDIFENKIKKGVVVDNTGIREIARVGEGMRYEEEGTTPTGQPATTQPPGQAHGASPQAIYKARDDIVIISWNKYAGETYYEVFRIENKIGSVSSGGIKICDKNLSGIHEQNTCVDRGPFSPGKKYNYYIYPYTETGQKDTIITNEITILGTEPTQTQPTPASSPPILTSIEPNTVIQSTTVTYVFKGQNFQDGAVLVFTGPSSGETPLDYISDTELRLAGPETKPIGKYENRIKNPDGQTSEAVSSEIVIATYP